MASVAGFLLGGTLLLVLASGCGTTTHAPVEPASLPAPPTPAPSVMQTSAPLAAPPIDPLGSCAGGEARFTDARRAGKAFTEEQRSAVTSAENFIHDHHDTQDHAVRAQLAEVEYARARALFEANHWGEAALAFRAVAVNHADNELGLYASQLFLESLNVLGSAADPPRPSCYDAMARDVPILVGLYCDDKSPVKDQERANACVLLRKIQRDIDRLSAQRLVERADKIEGGDAALFEEAGEAYVALARRCITESHAAHATPASEHCDELAYNAGKAFMAARKTDRVRDVARLMVDPANGIRESQLTARLVMLVKQL